jgi:molybdopterin biosynthesis enzyme
VLPAEHVRCSLRRPVLAEDVASRVNVPGFARSAMDGYALRGEDTFGASEYSALPFDGTFCNERSSGVGSFAGI